MLYFGSLILFPSQKDASSELAGLPPRPSALPRKARLAVTYLSLCTLSFFGAGNVASVASFEISSTWRFVTVFSPFLMGALLMYKVLGPMVVVGVAYRFSVSNANCSTSSLLRVNMAECSLVALFFFFNVKQVNHSRALRPTHLLLKPWRPLRTNAANAAAPTHFYIFTFLQEGSWKDIGMSITHFIMGNLLALLTTGTIALAACLHRPAMQLTQPRAVVSVISSCYVASHSSATLAKMD